MQRSAGITGGGRFGSNVRAPSRNHASIRTQSVPMKNPPGASDSWIRLMGCYRGDDIPEHVLLLVVAADMGHDASD